MTPNCGTLVPSPVHVHQLDDTICHMHADNMRVITLPVGKLLIALVPPHRLHVSLCLLHTGARTPDNFAADQVTGRQYLSALDPSALDHLKPSCL